MAIEITERTGAKRPRRSGAGAPGGGAKRGSYDRGESNVSDQEKREFIMDIQGVSENTVVGLQGKNLDKAWRKALTDAENPRQNKGGLPKKPKFMKGGSYKGKSHMYAAGGMVKELKI